ncbi:MAG: SpoVG family protein [Faecousia sp.]
MKIKARIDSMVDSQNIKAIASVTLDGQFAVRNLRVVDGSKGLFVACPQESYTGKDGVKKYSNLFYPISNAGKAELEKAVLDAYRLQMNPNYQPEVLQGTRDGVYPEHARFQQSNYQEPDYKNSGYAANDDMLPMYHL